MSTARPFVFPHHPDAHCICDPGFICKVPPPGPTGFSLVGQFASLLSSGHDHCSTGYHSYVGDHDRDGDLGDLNVSLSGFRHRMCPGCTCDALDPAQLRLTPARFAPGELKARSNGRFDRLVHWMGQTDEKIGHWPLGYRGKMSNYPDGFAVCVDLALHLDPPWGTVSQPRVSRSLYI